MTVKELREILWNVSEDAKVCCCSEYDNPYNDYFEVAKVVRVIDVSNSDFDRICLMEKS